MVPKGTAGVNGSLQLDSGEWTASKNKIQVGSCFLKVEGGITHFHVAVEGASADLRIKQSPKLYGEPDGKIAAGGFYESQLLIPAAEVEASYKTSLGSGERSGWAYMDHADIWKSLFPS